MATNHAILSASGAYRWLRCPGSVRMCKGAPRTSSVYADEGTAAHRLAEKCLQDDSMAESHLNERIEVAHRTFPVTRDMAEAVQLYLDTVRGDYLIAKDATMLFEQKFKLDWLYPGLWGTNDCMIGEPFGTLRVYDYKHGAGVAVEVENNEQAMYYGLGALRDSTTEGAYEDVELVIVQPRAPHPKGSVRRFRLTVDDLMKWGNEILVPGAKATENPDAPLNPGGHCRFCQALSVCPAQKKQAMEVAKEVFADTPSKPPAPEQLSLDEIRRVLDLAGLVEEWFNACRTHVRNLLETGAVTPETLGYKLVEGRKSREWVDEKSAEEFLLAMLDDEAYAPKKLISPAQAEKIMKGAPAKKMLQEMIRFRPGPIQLAPLSDKREQIASALTAFEGVL